MSVRHIGKASFQRVATGNMHDVYLSDGVLDEYEKLRQRAERNEQNSVKAWKQLERYLLRFCEHGHRNMPEDQFKSEGAFAVGDGKKIQIYAFKPWQWRLYGALREFNDRPCFLGTMVDPSKKNNKADRAILEASARAFIGMN